MSQWPRIGAEVVGWLLEHHSYIWTKYNTVVLRYSQKLFGFPAGHRTVSCRPNGVPIQNLHWTKTNHLRRPPPNTPQIQGSHSFQVQKLQLSLANGVWHHFPSHQLMVSLGTFFHCYAYQFLDIRPSTQSHPTMFQSAMNKVALTVEH